MQFSNKYGTVNYHNTTWNDKSLRGKSLEIQSINFFEESAVDLILDFCNQKSKESYLLIAVRIEASNIDLKKIYSACGFVIVEHTLNVSSFGIDFSKLESLVNKFPVIVDDYSLDDVKEIENISANEFKFGRFYEDPFIDMSIAIDRGRFWVEDLINQGAIIKVLRKKNIVVGFMAYKIKDGRADLILGGLKAKYRHLAYGFWANIFFNIRDVKQINTIISSSNIDVLNLYSYFGFRFENPKFGFHKHLVKF